MNGYPQAPQAQQSAWAPQAQAHPVPSASPQQNPRSKQAPVGLWVVGVVALALGAVAWFVPVGSSSGNYGFKLECPTAADSVRGMARVADLSRDSSVTARAAQGVAEECPQTAVALGVGVIASIGGLVVLLIAFVLTLSRAGTRPTARPQRPWVATRPHGV